MGILKSFFGFKTHHDKVMDMIARRREVDRKETAERYLSKNDPLWVAKDLFRIMEETIKYYNANEQERTKAGIVDLIEIMNSIDKEMTSKITKEYSELEETRRSKKYLIKWHKT